MVLLCSVSESGGEVEEEGCVCVFLSSASFSFGFSFLSSVWFWVFLENDHTTTKQSVTAIERRSQGNLMTKSLIGIVHAEDYVETEHMQTVFVVVPSCKLRMNDEHPPADREIPGVERSCLRPGLSSSVTFLCFFFFWRSPFVLLQTTSRIS